MEVRQIFLPMPADADNLFSHDASGHQTSRNSQKYTAGFNNEIRAITNFCMFGVQAILIHPVISMHIFNNFSIHFLR